MKKLLLKSWENEIVTVDREIERRMKKLLLKSCCENEKVAVEELGE